MKIEEKDGKLVITDFSEMEVYRIACTVEREGIHFYEKLRECVNTFKSQEALELLITEERRHLKFFQERLYELRRAQDEGVSEEEDLISSMDFGVFQPFSRMSQTCKAVEDVKKAFSLAVTVEDKSINLYEECKARVSSEDVKKELTAIIEEEKKHKDLFRRFLCQ